jgi:hypothetical protein
LKFRGLSVQNQPVKVENHRLDHAPPWLWLIRCGSRAFMTNVMTWFHNSGSGTNVR